MRSASTPTSRRAVVVRLRISGFPATAANAHGSAGRATRLPGNCATVSPRCGLRRTALACRSGAGTRLPAVERAKKSVARGIVLRFDGFWVVFEGGCAVGGRRGSVFAPELRAVNGVVKGRGIGSASGSGTWKARAVALPHAIAHNLRRDHRLTCAARRASRPARRTAAARPLAAFCIAKGL